MRLINEFWRWHALIHGWPLYKLVFKTKIYYEDEQTKENKRIKGGALIVSNHYSGLDYFITFFKYFGRKIHVIVLEEVFKKTAFLRWALSVIGAIRADRDVKRMRFLDEGISVLKNGGILQIYPEAYVTLDGKIHDFKPTYVLIALRAGVPIVPLVVDGRYGLFKRAHATIGRSINLNELCGEKDPSKEEIERLNKLVRDKVVELRADMETRISAEKRKKR